MATPIKMPDIGTTTDQVTLVNWLKQEGDAVNRGDPLCEIETDKATSELESVAKGILLKQMVSAGAQVSKGTVLAYVGKEGEAIGVEQAAPETETATSEVPAEPAAGVRVSPLIHNLASRLGVDLGGIRGSGPSGQIMRTDVLKAKQAAPARTAPAAPVMAAASVPVAPAPVPPQAAGAKDITISRNQLGVARTITKSHQEIVTINLIGRINMGNAMRLRERAQVQTGHKVAYDAIFVHAVAQAMKELPRFQCYFSNDKLVSMEAVNVGIAVSVEDDLFIPVIKEADGKTPGRINQEIRDLADKAAKNSLSLDEMSGASFTVTNLGMYPVQSFNAIIPPGQAGILAIGCIESVPTFKDNKFFLAESFASVTLSVDHRFINGRQAGQFLARVKELMENV